VTEARPVTIFIAEDNPILLQGLDRALSANGYAVETAPDGLSLMERLSAASTPPDLLLLDMMMPGMSGLEVAEAVHSDPRLADLPVMLITAAIGEQSPAPLTGGGQVEVLIKPFRLHDLLTKIETYVSRHRGRGGQRGRATSTQESRAS
jgi:CheY-like chemotaxis protein